MHILVSNNHAEVSAFRKALGPAASELKVVENNLSVLSLLSSHPLDIWSLVITNHQDEGINVETGAFLRNLSERARGSWPTVVVDPLFSEYASSSVRVVMTIEEAATVVRSLEQTAVSVGAPEAESKAQNGKDHVDLLQTRTVARPATPPTPPTVESVEMPRTTKMYDTVLTVDEDDETPDVDRQVAAAAPVAPVALASTVYEPETAPATQAPVEQPPIPKQVEPFAWTQNNTVEPTPVYSAPQSSEPVAPVVQPPVAQPQRPPVAQTQYAPQTQPMTQPVAQQAPAVVQQVALPQQVAAPVTQPAEQQQVAAPVTQPAVEGEPERLGMNAFEGRGEPARSLADDIRDWTERNEQQRGQTNVTSTQKSFIDGLLDLMPAKRRAAAEEEALDNLIREPRLKRCQSIAVISPKGGVGKSFLTYLIGNFLAEVRGDKIVAIDTNPDFGTLADQVRGREQQNVSTLLEKIEDIKHYSDLRRFTSKVESRLEVLAAPADPDVMATISSADYDRVNTQLQHYYDTVMFDCGTGFRDDITRYALEQADQVVLVSAPLFITTGIVVRALGYLDQVGVPLDRVTLAINQVRRDAPLDLNYMRERFGERLNAIVEIPFDMQLYHALDRGEFSVARTQQSTRIKVKQLLTHIVRHFD